MDITHSSLIDVVEAIRAGDTSSAEVMEALLERQRAVQPRINAVVAESPLALDDARTADAEQQEGQEIGPLHGLPFSVKDSFETSGFATDVDLRIRRQELPKSDATVIARMRAAGAVLMAKTNSPPNGHGRDTENAVSGRTLNPHNVSRSPGGSSGGEVALLASGGTLIGLGSDQSGGIRVPSHFCGVIGLKPTSGRIPNTGVYNQPGGLTDPRTQVGLLARYVKDIEYVLPYLIGPDHHDSGVAPVPIRKSSDVRVDELTVAYFVDHRDAPVTTEIADTVGKASQALAGNGVTMESAVPNDFIEMARELDYYWQDMPGTTGRTMVEVYSMWDDYRSQLLIFMSRYDAILCPPSPHVAPPYQERDPNRFSYTIPFNLTGYPALVVPVSTNGDGMPMGVQLAARPWREDVALALGEVLEREFGGWQPAT